MLMILSIVGIFIILIAITNIIHLIPNSIKEMHEDLSKRNNEIYLRMNQLEYQLEMKDNIQKSNIVVSLFLLKEDKLLLLRRFNTGFEDGKYSVITGYLETNQGVEESIVKLAKEYLGIEIEVENLEITSVIHKKEEFGSVQYFLKVNQWNGEVMNLKHSRFDEMKWVKIEDIPKETIPCIKRGIENYKSKVKFDSFGGE